MSQAVLNITFSTLKKKGNYDDNINDICVAYVSCFIHRLKFNQWTY